MTAGGRCWNERPGLKAQKAAATSSSLSPPWSPVAVMPWSPSTSSRSCGCSEAAVRRISASIWPSLVRMRGCCGPNRWPQWSTPRQWAINTFQSRRPISTARCRVTPSSTVSRSHTSNDGYGCDL